MGDFAKMAPKIISKSSKSPLGVISLGILVMSFLGYHFFVDASEAVRVSMFVLMFIGFVLLAYALLKTANSVAGSPKKGKEMVDNETYQAQVGHGPKIRGSSHTDRDGSILRLEAIRKISNLWMVGTCVIFGVLALWNAMGYYKGQMVAVWGWGFISLIPIVSALLIFRLFSIIKTDMDFVNRLRFNISFWLSVAYMSLVLLFIIYVPFSKKPTVTFFSSVNHWLIPLQAFVLIVTVSFMVFGKKTNN